MAGVNKVILIGNLGKDPEVRYLENGSVVANIALATSESYKDRNGNRIDQTEWHDLEMWDGLAKIAEQYLTKGKSIYVEGKIKSDTWQDEQGNNRKKIRIRVQNLTMLGGNQQDTEFSSVKGREDQQATSPPVEQASKIPAENAPTEQSGTKSIDLPVEDASDDLPF